LLHGAWVLATLAFADLEAASHLHGALRWIVVAFLAYGILVIPPLFWFTLHVRWNAPAAERLNR
jgi:hypothetical protein